MRYLFIFFSLLFSFQAHSNDYLRPDYPKRYLVQSGDTLWGIAGKYLHEPWKWHELWHANPHIKNPNRLYPGAILELHYYRSRPYIRVLSNGTVKMSPNIRPMMLENAIPPIPLIDIKPFLNASLIMDEDRLKNAPYVVAFMGERMRGGQGDEVYVEKLHPNPVMPQGATISYAVYRPGCPYYATAPKKTFLNFGSNKKNILGYKAKLIGYGELVRGGEPAVMLLTEITEGVRLKDRVMLNDYPEFKLYFEPKTPLYPVNGSIIDLPPGYTQGAVGQVAVIDQGQNIGLGAGDVLAIYSPHRWVNDPMGCKDCIKLPRERVGEIMIFRSFSKTSLGLVMRSIKAIHLGDFVTNP